MKIGRHFYLLIALFSFNTINAVNSIIVERVVVPPVAFAGSTVELQCLYREEGDDLYSLKWWRGEDHFYQYIPPKRSFYSINGVKVNMSETYSRNKLSPPGLEIVVLQMVSLETAGVFKCEVMADKIFQTVSREANMTVVYPPNGPPIINGGMEREINTIVSGQRITLLCTVPPANPTPRVQWKINGHHVKNSNWVIHHPPLFGGEPSGRSQVASTLDFEVTPQLLDESLNGLVIECESKQPESSYHKKAKVVLYPERTSYFWFFSSGEVNHSTIVVVLGSVTTLELLRYFF